MFTLTYEFNNFMQLLYFLTKVTLLINEDKVTSERATVAFCCKLTKRDRVWEVLFYNYGLTGLVVSDSSDIVCRLMRARVKLLSLSAASGQQVFPCHLQ